jgi:hypothetical protein
MFRMAVQRTAQTAARTATRQQQHLQHLQRNVRNFGATVPHLPGHKERPVLNLVQGIGVSVALLGTYASACHVLDSRSGVKV